MTRSVWVSLAAMGAVWFGTTSAVAEDPKFEMADVHPSSTAPGFVQNFGGVLRGGTYVNRDATLLDLIQAAYGVTADDVSGGPGWIASDVFDVVAKVPDGANMATANLMLRGLLADRFKLVARNETHPVPRYILTVAKGGPKLKKTSGDGNPGCRQTQGGGPPPGDPASAPNIKVSCRNLSSADIADNLRQMAGGYFDHDVIDKTALEGSWDFDLEWTARGLLALKGPEGISVFDALEKQLGLKAEVQNVPMPALVVESALRKPTPTPPDVAAALALAPARFEAASIKPADPDKPFGGLLYTGGSQMHAGGTLRSLIAMAFQIPGNVSNDLVLGLPKFADQQRWDILAKVPATGEGAPHIVKGQPLPPPFSVGLEMVQGLLLDDFGLKYHKENREITVYALVVNNGKTKMTPAADTERTVCKPDPNAPKPAPNVGLMVACKNTSMAQLAQNLQQQAGAYIDHPIVDATGLEGGWDFYIGWTPRNLLQPVANPNQPSSVMTSAADPTGISVFDAVEKLLGLKLVKQTRSIPVMVVDHIDDKPKE